jgi:signal transduction histidine kinase
MSTTLTSISLDIATSILLITENEDVSDIVRQSIAPSSLTIISRWDLSLTHDLDNAAPAIILSDIQSCPSSSLEHIKKEFPSCIIVLLSPQHLIETAVSWLGSGADEILPLPLPHPSILAHRIKHLIEYISIKRQRDKYASSLNHAQKKSKDIATKYDLLMTKNKSLSHFIKNASTFIQRPLEQIIQGANISLQRLKQKKIKLTGKYLTEMKWISEELILFINDLQEISKLKIGEGDFTLEEIDIVEFMQGFHRQFQPITDNHKITFSLFSDITRPCVLADYNKLSKIVNVLLRNAFRYVSEKGVVEITIFQKKNTIFVAIYDNGQGISEEKQKALFNMYRLSDISHKMEGLMGFSLPICKEIMNRQNGDLSLDNTNVKKGTRFVFSLPTAQTLLD